MLRLVSCAYLLFAHINVFAGNEIEIDKSFYTGELRLSKSFFDSSLANREALSKPYNNKEWEKLVNTVISSKADWDLYYFYLGRSAEELGYKEAAIAYYGIAINSVKAKRCGEVPFVALCDSFTFPKDAQLRFDSLRAQGRSRLWPLNEGPSYADIVGGTPMSIEDMFSKSANSLNVKSKFESDEEFKLRLVNENKDYFLSFPLDTSKDGKCLSKYNRENKEYEINQCVAISSGTPVLKTKSEGASIGLANAFDKREIKRILFNEYYVNYNVSWSASFRVGRDVAEKADSDLMVGLVFSNKETASECAICRTRDLSDSISDLGESLAKFNGKSHGQSMDDWRQQAFRKGVVEEYWRYSLKPISVKKFIIYTKSNSKVLYELGL